MTLRGALVVSLVGLFALSCSSSDSGGGSNPPASCTDDPSSCAAGTVCWPSNTSGDYACLAAATGHAQGTPCQNIVAQPTCDVGLACFPTDTVGNGVCAPYCSLTKPTPGQCAPPASNGSCVEVLLQAPHQHPIHVCQPGVPQNDGGAGTGGGAGAGTGGGAGMAAGGSAGTISDAGTD